MQLEEIMARDDFQRCRDFHGHVCPGLAIGYVVANKALDWLAEKRCPDEELVAIVENDACCVDAVQVLTGCTFGKGNLIYKDYGKMAFTFFDRRSGRGVRLSMRDEARPNNERQVALFRKKREQGLTEEETSEWEAMYRQRMTEILCASPDDVFACQPVSTDMPDQARIVPSRPCNRCGEPTMVNKMETVDDQAVCRACAAL